MISKSIDRRMFLKTATVLPALSLLPSGCITTEPRADNSMVFRVKKPAIVRGAFFYPPQDVVLSGDFEDGWKKEKWSTWPGNQFEPEAQQAKFMQQLRKISDGLDITPAIDDAPIYTSAGIESFIQDVGKNKPDALLLFNFWNTMSSKLAAVLDAYDGPIILYHPVGANHQLPPKHFETAPRVQYIHSIENWDALERGLRAVHAHKRMAQSRMLRVAEYPAQNNETKEPLFGMSICSIPAEQFNTLFDKTQMTPELEKLARSVRAQATSVHDLSNQAFVDAVRAHATVKQLLNRYEADAITIKCLFLKHRKPCLSFALNNSKLIPCGCENDYNATLSMMLGANMFGRGGFQHNPEFDTEENLYLASHCTCATQLHGPKSKSSPYKLRPFFHQLPKTLALDVEWPAGEPVTLFKCLSDEKQLSAWGGKVLYSPTCPPVGGCATRALVKMDNVQDVRSVYQGPHPILYCGNFVRQVETFAQLYDFQICTNG